MSQRFWSLLYWIVRSFHTPDLLEGTILFLQDFHAWVQFWMFGNSSSNKSNRKSLFPVQNFLQWEKNCGCPGSHRLSLRLLVKPDQIVNLDFAEWNIVLEPKWPLFSWKMAFFWKVEAPKYGTNRFQDFVEIRLPNLLVKFDMTILSICYLPLQKTWRVANLKHWLHPPRSLTVRRWKRSILRGKNHLPIVIFQLYQMSGGYIIYLFNFDVFVCFSHVEYSCDGLLFGWATTEMSILTRKFLHLTWI